MYKNICHLQFVNNDNTAIAPMKVTSEFLAENNDHLTLRNAAGEVEFRANEADLKSVRYGDYITHKVSKVFPDLFKESHIVDNLKKQENWLLFN